MTFVKTKLPILGNKTSYFSKITHHLRNNNFLFIHLAYGKPASNIRIIIRYTLASC